MHITLNIVGLHTLHDIHAAFAGAKESYLLHSGTQARGKTRKEIINSSWRTETETHSPANRKVAEGGGMPPIKPSNPIYYSEARSGGGAGRQHSPHLPGPKQ